ncbi:MAG: orotidine-5'-phosphate decarboxylase [Acidobacteria bacterium]|nr:orotidine-5'-phosphate decarboxylase [Acidobacteriota bacterium]MCA1611845.1 orotidine-5'-phosphate decarboxylase [Acidobacteriota bacterium]
MMAPGEESRRTGSAARVCLALDFASRKDVVDAARRFAPRAGWLKIGLEAFISEGPSLVADVAATGARVFLDLKLHDIPNTVARAVSAAAATGAAMVNVHALGGREMLLAARGAGGAGANRPLLIAVTLLTSLDSRALSDLPVSGTPEGIARRLAVLARDCGLDGVVCSPSDLPAIRSACGPSFLTVVPGIRPEGGVSGDQKRTGTPRAAIAAGADILVVGRPVTAAADPDAALAALLDEIESARMPSR